MRRARYETPWGRKSSSRGARRSGGSVPLKSAGRSWGAMVRRTRSAATWPSSLVAKDSIARTIAFESTTASATAMVALASVKRCRSVRRFQTLTILEETCPPILWEQSPPWQASCSVMLLHSPSQAPGVRDEGKSRYTVSAGCVSGRVPVGGGTFRHLRLYRSKPHHSDERPDCYRPAGAYSDQYLRHCTDGTAGIDVSPGGLAAGPSPVAAPGPDDHPPAQPDSGADAGAAARDRADPGPASERRRSHRGLGRERPDTGHRLC